MCVEMGVACLSLQAGKSLPSQVDNAWPGWEEWGRDHSRASNLAAGLQGQPVFSYRGGLLAPRTPLVTDHLPSNTSKGLCFLEIIIF